jgi:hypothetical protein
VSGGVLATVTWGRVGGEEEEEYRQKWRRRRRGLLTAYNE